MLLANLLLAGLMVVLTSTIQFTGLVGLSWVLRRRYTQHPEHFIGIAWQGVSIITIVIGLFMLHAVQIWVYTLTYLALSQFETIETALYFSTSTFTTVGFGDVILDSNWRMLAAAESANGFLLIGWSTAFLVSVTTRVRMFEAEIEHLDQH